MFRKVLFPTDFSEGAEEAAKRFERVNEMPVGEVILLHVIDEGAIEDLMNGYSLLYENEELELKEVEEKLKMKAMERLQSKVEDVKRIFKTEKVKPVVRFGIPWEEIVRVAEEEDVSLILLPTHGKLGFSKELLGSTAMRVVKKTLRPVLLLKPKCKLGGEEE
ncbi:universal stress protein [Thermococcus peptonophilus]|uniref:Universal stress protein n=1 Tax=Thermococcus peptonophilus TaxID=53952 RepID=A0A142CX91_9EURY|nr:universal stress protein [Thermococcus peptonophilus]AMQ19393.1 universal stress protein [Thermococcus peptonophilus]